MSREVLQMALEALVTAEAGLADIGDADREPTDDLAWCEERAEQALAKPRQAIAALHEALAQQEEQQSCDRPEQMARLGWQCFECPACGSEGARAFPKPEQEPVAWLFTDAEGTEFFEQRGDWIGKWEPLYTSPPQHKWAGLTEEDMDVLFPYGSSVWVQETVKIIEAKLKEKNK